jgi:hypothetical protein
MVGIFSCVYNFEELFSTRKLEEVRKKIRVLRLFLCLKLWTISNCFKMLSIFGLFRKRLLIFLFLETGENVIQFFNYHLDINDFAAWK